MDQVALSAEGISVSFGGHRVLVEVDLTVSDGEVLGLIGPNGAGKSTLLGILSTLVRPSHGTVAYFAGAAEVRDAEVRREIGMLAHASLCYAELSATENLELVAGLYELRTDPQAELDRVGLDRKARDRAARTYSRGMVQRLALARALMTNPSLILLDEPFTGLDREGALALGAELGAMREAGAIVVVVTHDLEAIAGRADHVAILRRGKLVFDERADRYDYAQLKDIYHRQAN